MAKILMTLALAAALPAAAQHHPQGNAYAGMQARDIKALSDDQLLSLREGRGMGASLAAELNGVPGPLHVLQLRDQLQVTPTQRAALEQIVATMKASAQRLGAEVIDGEREMDRAFRNGQADEESIRSLSRRLGALNAELRAAHLVAHLQTRQVLSDAQVKAYNQARGYAD